MTHLLVRGSAFLMNWSRFPCFAQDFRVGLPAERSIPLIGPVNSARQSPTWACSVPKLDPARRSLQMGCGRRLFAAGGGGCRGLLGRPPPEAPRPDFSRYPAERPRIGRHGRCSADSCTWTLTCKNTGLGSDGLAIEHVAYALLAALTNG